MNHAPIRACILAGFTWPIGQFGVVTAAISNSVDVSGNL